MPLAEGHIQLYYDLNGQQVTQQLLSLKHVSLKMLSCSIGLSHRYTSTVLILTLAKMASIVMLCDCAQI